MSRVDAGDFITRTKTSAVSESMFLRIRPTGHMSYVSTSASSASFCFSSSIVKTIAFPVVVDWSCQYTPQLFASVKHMGTNNEKKRDHELRGPLESTIASAVGNNADVAKITDMVLRTLDQQKMISYSPTSEISLLSPAGRVLVAIMEDPAITQRALSVYLGVTESNIQKSVRVLCRANLITKVKIKNKNTYQINKYTMFAHSDICRFFDAVKNLVEPQESEDEPF